jgi:hypothetical protein
VVIPEGAVQAAHTAICEQNLDDCLDPDWRGKCVKAVEAATPSIRALAFAEADGVMVDRLQAAVSAALALAQEWEYERANFEEIHDYSNYRLSVLNNAAQKLRDAIGSALRVGAL